MQKKMPARKSSLWCVAKECNYISIKRHFFMFPKEYDRWLHWIHACGRHDLKAMGPEYAHRNYRLCHLHFEEKWYKIGKIRAHLHPNAIPTIFFGRNDIFVTIEPVKTEESEDVKSIEEKNNVVVKTEIKTENNIIENHQQEEINSDIQLSEEMPINEEYLEEEYLEMFANEDAEIVVKPSTSNATTVKKTLQEKKLIKQNLKLKAENKRLHERIRQLLKKIENLENKKITTKESEKHKTLRQLGR